MIFFSYKSFCTISNFKKQYNSARLSSFTIVDVTLFTQYIYLLSILHAYTCWIYFILLHCITHKVDSVSSDMLYIMLYMQFCKIKKKTYSELNILFVFSTFQFFDKYE